MPDVLQVCFRAASSAFLECVQADVNIGTMRILKAEPRLEVSTSDASRCAHALDGFAALSIAHDDGKPVREFEVLVEILSEGCLGGFGSRIRLSRRL